jgi:hypothetical protein
VNPIQYSSITSNSPFFSEDRYQSSRTPASFRIPHTNSLRCSSSSTQPYKKNAVVGQVVAHTTAILMSVITINHCNTLQTTVSSPNSITTIKSITAIRPRASRIINSALNESGQENLEKLKAIARIQEIAAYLDNWNGPDSIAPTALAAKEAELFTRYIFSHNAIISPYISASNDGEINFYWKRDEFILDLGFFGGGSYSYYAHLPNGLEILEDQVSLHAYLPQEIVDLIRNKM